MSFKSLGRSLKKINRRRLHCASHAGPPDEQDQRLYAFPTPEKWAKTGPTCLRV